MQVKQILFELQVAHGLRHTWQTVLLLAKAKLPRQEAHTLGDEHCKQLAILHNTQAPPTKLYPV
jgi:hypothetical protein